MFELQSNTNKKIANISKKFITFYDKVVCSDEYTCTLIFNTFSRYINAAEDTQNIELPVVENTDSSISFVNNNNKYTHKILKMCENYIILDGETKISKDNPEMPELAFNAFNKFLMTIHGGND